MIYVTFVDDDLRTLAREITALLTVGFLFLFVNTDTIDTVCQKTLLIVMFVILYLSLLA